MENRRPVQMSSCLKEDKACKYKCSHNLSIIVCLYVYSFLTKYPGYEKVNTDKEPSANIPVSLSLHRAL